MPSGEPSRDQLIDGTEHWFQHRGLPYNGTRDVSPFVLVDRVIRLLALVLVAEALTMTLGGRYRGWSLLGVFALSMSGVVLVGLLVSTRRPRRAKRLPRWWSVVAAGVFVAGPAILAAVVDSEPSVVTSLLLFNAVALVIVLLLEFYNVLPIVRHEFAEIRSGERTFFPPLRQVLPILLIVLLFLFMTAEIWQVSHDMTALAYAIVIVALVGFSAGFVVVQIGDRLDDVSHFDSWTVVDEVARSTSAPYLPLPHHPSAPPNLEQDAVGRNEIGLFVFVVVTVQLVVVATVVSTALTLFGVLVIRRQTILQWTEMEAADWDPIASISIFANEYALTKETLLMSGLLGVVAAMQFAISISSDSDFSAEHVNGLKDDAREVLAVRSRYARYLSEAGTAEQTR